MITIYPPPVFNLSQSSHEHIKIKEANNAAGIPSLVSKEFIQTDEMEEGLCEIRFQVSSMFLL